MFLTICSLYCWLMNDFYSILKAKLHQDRMDSLFRKVDYYEGWTLDDAGLTSHGLSQRAMESSQ